MHNQINKIQYVDLRNTHYWYDLNESDLSPELVIKDDEDIPMPDSIEPPTIETKKYVYNGYLKHGDFLILRDAHKAHLLFMNTRGTIEHIIPNAKHKEQLRTLGLPKEVMKGKGDVAACVRLAHGIRKDPKAWGMSTGPAIPAFVEKLKEVNATFHSVHHDAIRQIEQLGMRGNFVERQRTPGLYRIAVYDDDSDFCVYFGRQFFDTENATEVASEFVQNLPRILNFIRTRNECIQAVGRVRTDINFHLADWETFTDTAVDIAIDDMNADILCSDSITVFTMFITQPEIYLAPRHPGNEEKEWILLWNCYSQAIVNGVALRPFYKGHTKDEMKISWADLEKHFGITEEMYNFHTEIQSQLEVEDESESTDGDFTQSHHILRICYQSIMDQKKGIESYTPDGGFDSLE